MSFSLRVVTIFFGSPLFCRFIRIVEKKKIGLKIQSIVDFLRHSFFDCRCISRTVRRYNFIYRDSGSRQRAICHDHIIFNFYIDVYNGYRIRSKRKD